MSKQADRLRRRDFLKTTASFGFGALGALGAFDRVSAAITGPKITGIKTFKFNVDTGPIRRDPQTGLPISSGFKTWLFLKIETDTDLHGWGEASIEWLSPVVEQALHGFEPLLIGRNPLDVVAICDDITDRIPWKGGPVIGSALAAINMALYDLAGKALKVPVYQLFGGRKRDRVRVYSGGLKFSTVNEARQAARAETCGFRRIP